jgi:ribosome modulation factor
MYLVRTHSAGYAFGIKNNSNTMLRYQRTDSAALMYLVRTHSAGYAFGIKNNSNTMLRYQRTDSAALMYLIRTHSNAYKFGIKNNSNTLLYVSRTHSNAIKWLDTQMQEIDNGPLNIEITTATYNMDFDFNLSGDHYATVSVDCTIEGDGHSINFARDAEDLIRISAGKTLTLNNVVLRGYSDGAVQLGAGASIVFGDGTYIELADKQTLSRDWTFDGAVQVNGFGYQLDLSDYNITVNEGASATFKNVSVDGLLGTNLNCADNTAEVKFNNTNLHMAGNYTFDHGAFSVEQNVVLSGTEESEFKYQSDQTSTIGADSTLVVDTGVKFSYEPVDSDDRDLIAMSDDTSRLYLNGCTLNTTTTGMRLTKGTLIVDGHNYLYDDDATSVSEGFSLGNGEATDDITIYLTPGAVLDLKSGYLDYNNDAVG